MYKARISRNCKTKANKQKARGKGRKPRRKWKFRNTHIIKKRSGDKGAEFRNKSL